MMASSVDSVGSVGTSPFLRFYLDHFPLVASAAAVVISAWCGCGVAMIINIVVSIVTAYYYLRPTKVEGGERYNVIIIGAGFSGIAAGIKLDQAGVKYTILEKSTNLGGTWWINKYPGAACDVASHLYSYSFFLNPWWSRAYSHHVEIRSYLESVALHYNIHRHVQFGKTVTKCEWNEATAKWTVTTSDGNNVTANFVIQCAGKLHVPLKPNIKGMSDFSGPLFHTAEWRSDVSLKGKRVAVIGTGASAVQVIPNIAKDVDQLYVFQRTPCWSPPRNDFAYAIGVKWLFALMPPLMALYRYATFWINEFYFHVVFSGQFGFTVAKLYGRFTASHVKSVVKDPVLAEKLTPKYMVGCKRITPSDVYLKSFNLPNVHLVTDSIETITKSGLRTTKEDFGVDVIVLATGFDLLKSFHAFEVVGKDGAVFEEQHGDLPKAYKGTVCINFPNFFNILGPNTGLGHNSAIFVIECQLGYIVDCIRGVISLGHRSLEVRPHLQDSHMKRMYEGLKGRVWILGGCMSWYKNADGQSFALYPFDLTSFWRMLRSADLRDFVLA